MSKIIPDKYQQKVLDCILHDTYNIVINAVAGSGKTTLIVKSVEQIPPNKSILIIAFNKKVVEKLKEKLSDYKNVKILTCHSLGYNIIAQNSENDVKVNEDKYVTYFDNILTKKKSEGYFKGVDYRIYRKNLLLLIHFARENFAQSEKEIKETAIKYKINILSDEAKVIKDALRWGSKHTDKIDYTDMIWLPNENRLHSRKLYDFVLIDEAQDLSSIEQDICLNMVSRGGRFMAVGDVSQCIYCWAGADANAFKSLNKKAKDRGVPVKEFDLPVTYRCGKKIAEYSAQYLKSGSKMIMARDGAQDGEVILEAHLNQISDGDLVICRNSSPLFKLRKILLETNRKCYFDDSDELVNNLMDLLNNSTSHEELNQDLSKEGVFMDLYCYFLSTVLKNCYDNKVNFDESIISARCHKIYDDIMTLTSLAETCKTRTELIEKISLILKTKREGIKLMTIHKAKGQESNNVYILCPSLMPTPLATEDWEIECEQNLQYVAATRAINRLGYISERDFKPGNVFTSKRGMIEKIREIYDIAVKNGNYGRNEMADKVINDFDTTETKTKVQKANRNKGSLKFLKKFGK